MTTMDALGEKVALRPGATSADLARVEGELDVQLPEDLKQVLRRSDGFEGFVSPHAYVMLWSCKEIIALNRGYCVAEFVPGVTLIGTDGGGIGYGFSWNGSQANYVDVPLVGMDPSEVAIVGDSFAEFIDRLGKQYRG